MPLLGISVDIGEESSDADDDTGDRGMMHAEIDAIVGELDKLALQTSPSNVPCTGSSPKPKSVRDAPSSLPKHFPSAVLVQPHKTMRYYVGV